METNENYERDEIPDEGDSYRISLSPLLSGTIAVENSKQVRGPVSSVVAYFSMLSIFSA